MTKYTESEIERVINERVTMKFYEATLKKGLICEWTFKYPTGYITADVESTFPMNEEDHDPVIAHDLILAKIERKVWEICGKYTLATGDKL